MSHHFVGFFGRRIKTDWCIGGVALGEPFSVAVAVDRAGRSEYEMRWGRCSTRIDEVLEADDIALDVGAGVLQLIPNARLRREVDHTVKIVLGK